MSMRFNSAFWITVKRRVEEASALLSWRCMVAADYNHYLAGGLIAGFSFPCQCSRA